MLSTFILTGALSALRARFAEKRLITQHINFNGHALLRKLSNLKSKCDLIKEKLTKQGKMKLFLHTFFCRASFTSELAVRQNLMPFDGLQGLLSSSYSLLVKKGGNTQATFDQANPESLFGQLYDKKVTEFLPTDRALQALNAR